MDYQVIAESIVHSERRLLVGREGHGYIQLDSTSTPIAVPDQDFARLRTMGHYRPVVSPMNAIDGEPAEHQVAD